MGAWLGEFARDSIFDSRELRVGSLRVHMCMQLLRSEREIEMVHLEIRVVNGSGSPESNVEVSVQQLGAFGGFTSDCSDRNGVATFDLDMSPSDKLKVHAKGSIRYEGYPQAKLTVVV